MPTRAQSIPRRPFLPDRRTEVESFLKRRPEMIIKLKASSTSPVVFKHPRLGYHIASEVPYPLSQWHSVLNIAEPLHPVIHWFSTPNSTLTWKSQAHNDRIRNASILGFPFDQASKALFIIDRTCTAERDSGTTSNPV